MASETLRAPSSSILFLLMAHTCKLGVPILRASEMWVAPVIPNPQLFMKNICRLFASDK